MIFNAREAKALLPGMHIVVQGCPGLRLEASVSRKTWTYRYRSPVDGKLRQVKIGTWPEMPPVAAASKWSELRAARDAGQDLAVEKKVQRLSAGVTTSAGYTVGQLVRDYADGYLDKHREPKGAKAVRVRLIAATEDLAKLPAARVTRRIAFDLVESLSDKPVLAKSVKTELAAAWRYALESGRLPEDTPEWWSQVMRRRLPSKGAVREGQHKGLAKRVLNDAEIKALMHTDMPLFSQQVADFLTLQLWTCTRGAEIVQLKPEYIKEENGVLWWTMPKSLTKVGRYDNAVDLRVPLFGRAAVVVRRLLLAGGEWLFPSTSRTGTVGAQSQAYMGTKVHYLQPYSKAREDHVRKRLTVTHWSPHDLRRTGRTLLASIGCPHEVGEAILGHVLPGVAGDYNLYRYDKERCHWLAALDARLEHIIAA